MKYLLLFSLFCLFCAGCTKQAQDQDLLLTVDFESCLKTERAMNISEIADTVEYLELKTPKDIIISRIWDVIQADGCWIVRSISGISKFSLKGEWIKQIGKKGQGPGEYLGVRGIDYDPARKEIILADAQQVLFYDLDGNYIRNVKITEDYFYNIGVSDTVLWTTALGLHQEKHQVHAFNYKKDTLVAFPNPHYGIRVKNADAVYFSSSRWEKEFYRYDGGLYLKNRMANDTVFRLSGAERIPHIAFDMGKYKLPVEYEYWYSTEDFDRYASAYWAIPSVAEDDRFLFLLSKRWNSLSDNPREPDKDDKRFIVYDKETRNGFTVKGEYGVQLEDDILGGSVIWPRFITADYYIWTREWYELSDEIKAGLYPSLSPALAKQFEGFNYGTNELVILCKRKDIKK